MNGGPGKVAAASRRRCGFTNHQWPPLRAGTRPRRTQHPTARTLSPTPRDPCGYLSRTGQGGCRRCTGREAARDPSAEDSRAPARSSSPAPRTPRSSPHLLSPGSRRSAGPAGSGAAPEHKSWNVLRGQALAEFRAASLNHGWLIRLRQSAERSKKFLQSLGNHRTPAGLSIVHCNMMLRTCEACRPTGYIRI